MEFRTWRDKMCQSDQRTVTTLCTLNMFTQFFYKKLSIDFGATVSQWRTKN